ncbi:MAG: aminotransferase [Demequinaceae bacterium]|nr:aminotransferase [Demequinaceae bacterium]
MPRDATRAMLLQSLHGPLAGKHEAWDDSLTMTGDLSAPAPAPAGASAPMWPAARDEALAKATAFLSEAFGLGAAEVAALGSNEDINVVASLADGERVLLRVSHSGVSRAQLDAQNAALRWLGGAPDFPYEVPMPLLSRQGADVEAWVDGSRLARVLTFVEGAMPTAAAQPAPGLATRLGRAAGTLASVLSGFGDVGFAGGGDWDLRSARRVVTDAAGSLSAGSVLEPLAAAEARMESVRGALRVQVIHGDLTADNVVLDDAGEVRGVIDFGDVDRGWLAAELAVCACSLLQHDGDPIAQALDAIAAFDSECALDEADIVALWPLVVSRAAVLVASAERVLAQDPYNGYALARVPCERRMLDRALSLGFDEAEILIRAAVGRLAPVPAELSPMIRGLGDAVETDLSVTSQLHDAGAWTGEGHLDMCLADAWVEHRVAVMRYGEYRLTSRAISGSVPRSLALGIDVALDDGTEVVAPAEGTIVSRDGQGADASLGLTLEGGATVWVRGVEPVRAHGERVVAGAVIGRARPASVSVTDASHAGSGGGGARSLAVVGIEWCLAPGLEPPAMVAPRAEALWRAACPDPSTLVGRAPDASRPHEPTSSALLARREAAFATVQEHYYAEPPQIERGWRHHLVDTKGRAYLDMINNVAILGHGEPRLTDAVAAQMARLNTNSRFHYEALVEFSEALAARAPQGLDTVMLVNSGSEAVDLAIRIARAVTARQDILALTEAYHGWTVGADAISTSIGDNPGALETRPDWVHLLDSPNTYRGRHRGAEGHLYLADALARLEELDGRGVALAGMVSEPIFGNGGGILLPDGYLRGLWDAVRARGGVCVSDEVQVSYGRLGEHFWGFEQQGVVPDIITVAKGMGNGYPLGAVITTARIADAFAAEGSFFSSAGGSGVSCVVGSTVLRVLEEDGLQDNARVVGAVLADGLRHLATRHGVLGAVHGMGLYLGVEVVAGGPDRPDPEAAAAICVDLLEEGVIVQPTGDHKNVLKIKPPLTIDAASVARFLEALDGVMERRASRAGQ